MIVWPELITPAFLLYLTMLYTTFEKCIEVILKWEAGYVNNPNDSGGETNFGIAKKFYPDLDIKNLTKEDAIKIYKRDYWDKNNINYYPEYIRLQMFDMFVNQGTKGAIRVLQLTLNKFGRGLDVDGVSGENTFKALQKTVGEDAKQIFPYMIGIERLNYYINLTIAKNSQIVFLKGWTRRANEVLMKSLE